MRRALRIQPGKDIQLLKKELTAGHWEEEVCAMVVRLPAGRYLRLNTKDRELERKLRRSVRSR